MGVAGVFAIMLYVLGMVPTYVVFKETTSQSTFNKIWFTVLWPTVAILQGVVSTTKVVKSAISKIKSWFKKK